MFQFGGAWSLVWEDKPPKRRDWASIQLCSGWLQNVSRGWPLQEVT